MSLEDEEEEEVEEVEEVDLLESCGSLSFDLFDDAEDIDEEEFDLENPILLENIEVEGTCDRILFTLCSLLDWLSFLKNGIGIVYAN